MSEPITVWVIETGKPLQLASPSEARRMLVAGVATDVPPVAASAPTGDAAPDTHAAPVKSARKAGARNG